MRSTRDIDIYAGRRPEDVPAYTLREAARLVSVPRSTLRAWVMGRSFPKRGGPGRCPRIIAPAVPDGSFLSFTNVVEAHVLSVDRIEEALRAAPKAA